MSAGCWTRPDVVWQIAELGKVDAGGGGTVAMYMANRNIATLDAGVPVLSMHAPFETVAKLDCYMTYKGMQGYLRGGVKRPDPKNRRLCRRRFLLTMRQILV